MVQLVQAACSGEVPLCASYTQAHRQGGLSLALARESAHCYSETTSVPSSVWGASEDALQSVIGVP